MTIRQAAVAGILYDADTQRLLVKVESWLENSSSTLLSNPPKVLIVPHSNFLSSGQTAAMAFRLLEPVYDRIKKVVILGTAHQKHVTGLVLPDCDSFETPLGNVLVDTESVHALLNNKNVHASSIIHEHEHSIEMQLPFLQTLLDDFTIIPLLQGDAEPSVVADILRSLWGGEETLIVISTGLSRKLPLEEATAQDQRTAERIASYDDTLTYADACGYCALNGLLSVVKEKNLKMKTIALTTSAQASGIKDRVRGFGAFAFY